MNALAKIALDNAKRQWGHGWSLLTDEMRDAFVAREAVSLLLTQDASLTKFQAGKELVEACMAWRPREIAAGLSSLKRRSPMADPIPLPDLIAKCEQARQLLREVDDAAGRYYYNNGAHFDDGWNRGMVYAWIEIAREHIGRVAYSLQTEAKKPAEAVTP